MRRPGLHGMHVIVLPTNHAGSKSEERRLRQRRLSRSTMPEKDDVADLVSLVLFHPAACSWRCLGPRPAGGRGSIIANRFRPGYGPCGHWLPGGEPRIAQIARLGPASSPRSRHAGLRRVRRSGGVRQLGPQPEPAISTNRECLPRQGCATWEILIEGQEEGRP